MIDIGCVLYQKGDEPGTLYAKWCHSYSGSGTGKATGGPVKGFTGRYRLRYFDNAGNVDADVELDIQKKGDFYELSWMKDGEEIDKGIGMEIAGGLAAGWRGINETVQ